MASTNHTTNYNLSQYIGGDKPTYLGDYNGDMQKIDAQMKTNADNIATAISGVESATSTANSAVSTANSANTTAQSASTTANSANTTATNAQSTANSALSTATSAQATANTSLALASKMNFTTFKNVANADISFSNGATIQSNSLSIATNSDGSIAKIYGTLDIQNPNKTSGTITIASSLRPTDENGDPTNLTINGLMIRVIGANLPSKNISMQSVGISSTGNITMPIQQVDPNTSEVSRYMFFAVVLFLKPFSDSPIE